MSSLHLSNVLENEVCAVTGANGFLGFHIVSQLLEKNIKTVVIVRSENSAKRLKEVFSQQVKTSLLKFAYVPDISQSNEAYEEAFNGATYVIHTASPIFQLDQKSTNSSKDFLDPAINGALNALTSAAKHKSIKRLVITGSVAARYISLTQTNGEVRRDSLLPITREEAEELTHPGLIYRASKSLSEGAIREWVEEHQPHFETTILIPALLLGPHADPLEDKLVGSNSVYKDWLDDPIKHLDNHTNVTAADVRDAAKAHINAALENITDPYFIGSLQSYFVVERTLHAFEALQELASSQDMKWDKAILEKLKKASEETYSITRSSIVPWREEDAKALSIHPMRNSVDTFTKFISQANL